MGNQLQSILLNTVGTSLSTICCKDASGTFIFPIFRLLGAQVVVGGVNDVLGVVHAHAVGIDQLAYEE
jgi:hypothetical protein